MIQSPVPGMTAARASEHTLQGLVSNLNAYAEAWTPVTTASPDTALTVAQVIAKNLRLEAGAGSAFTLTLPPTARILDALGPTLPQDGSFWFPFYVYNNSVGQTATLTAGDGDTVIDPTGNTLPSGHVSKWMVNVVAAADGMPTTPMTLNFHFVFTANVGSGGGCPPDLPPVLLIFGQSPDPNEILQYDITQPGVDKARLLSAGFLGSGTISYAPFTFDSSGPSGIYNVRDDKMYFLADKTDSSGPTTTAVLVQFDPRTLAISGEMALPLGATASHYILVDVADQSAWITCSDDGSLREFDLNSFTQLFTDGGALFTLAGVTTAGIACNSGQLLLPDANSATVIHLISVLSATTFSDVSIVVPRQGDFAEDGASRRRWIADRNKAIIPVNALTGVSYLVDLNDFTSQDAYAETANRVSIGLGPYWDPYLHRVISPNAGMAGGIFVGDDTGGSIGACANGGSYLPTPFTLGGLALASGTDTFGADALAGFDETVPSTVPAETYPRSDGFVFPNGQAFVFDNLCIAVKRKGCLPIDPTQRGSGLQAAYAGTGTGIAFFRLPNSLASDDNFQWTPGTGVTNALNNDAFSYSVSGTPGIASASFTTVDGKTVTVTQGIITSVV